MSTVILIAALSANHVIGRDGDLPWKLDADWAHFRKVTDGWPMIQGRKSASSRHALYGKEDNIILTSAESLDISWPHRIAHSLQEAIQSVQSYEKVFVLGGEGVFHEAITFADEMMLTHVEVEVEGDACFPEFDAADWDAELVMDQAADAHNDHPFRIIHWRRKRTQ